MGWIEENYHNYSKSHMISLIIGAASSSATEDTNLVAQVDRLYEGISKGGLQEGNQKPVTSAALATRI